MDSKLNELEPLFLSTIFDFRELEAQEANKARLDVLNHDRSHLFGANFLHGDDFVLFLQLNEVKIFVLDCCFY